jgi:hypothetical protein
MNSLEPSFGKYDLLVRLFSLIEGLPSSRQLELLRQIVGDRLNEQLFKLIVEMPEARQLELLERIGSLPDLEPPEKTVSLEETESSMRESMRRVCLINAGYTVRGRNYRSYILDISIGGVFIETGERFSVGESITVNFTLPNQPAALVLRGIIAWSGPRGFGVRFERLAPPVNEAIQRFVRQGSPRD